MKRTTLTITILFSLTGPVSVAAEVPAVTVNPLAVEVVPAAVESAAQQAVEALPTAATAAGAGLVQPQPIPETNAAEAVDAAAAIAEEQVVSETPAEAAAPVVEMTGEQEAVSETAAVDTAASGATKPGKPCPMYGMGMKRMGKDQPGKGMGGMMRGAGCKEKHKRHEQVVQRLDMIEARMAKIEAMLESLMKR
jgi:hypothetical protein